jgi:hypothetical protein
MSQSQPPPGDYIDPAKDVRKSGIDRSDVRQTLKRAIEEHAPPTEVSRGEKNLPDAKTEVEGGD